MGKKNYSKLLGSDGNSQETYLLHREVGKIDFEDITDMVIAWRPLPEPYIPKTQDERENYEPDWKRNFRKKFERRM